VSLWIPPSNRPYSPRAFRYVPNLVTADAACVFAFLHTVPADLRPLAEASGNFASDVTLRDENLTGSQTDVWPDTEVSSRAFQSDTQVPVEGAGQSQADTNLRGEALSDAQRDD
jgi:hypothetical protein